MSDTTDIDIDAERKAYREWRIRVLRACGMYPGETDQRDTYRLDAWFERARIAAERERELQEEIKRLKKQVPKPRPTVTCTVCQGTGWCESGRHLCDVCCGDGWMYYVEEPKGPSDER